MHPAVVGLFAYLFFCFYSYGMGPVPFTMCAEVFPLEFRMVGMSFGVSVNLLGAGLVTLFVPVLINEINSPGLLGIFAGLNLLLWFLVFFFVRETAGATVRSTYGTTKTRASSVSSSPTPEPRPTVPNNVPSMGHGESAARPTRRVYDTMTYMMLEELNYIFDVPATTYFRYQTRCVLPWFFRHYLK